jgi:hypothetical protein
MKKLVCILAIVSMTSLVGAQGVAIHGRVTDSAGNGLGNTIVRLAILGNETETNATGYYAIGVPVGVKLPGMVAASANLRPQMSAGRVSFTVGNDNARVSLRIFTLEGKLVGDLLTTTLARGNYSFPLDAGKLTAQPYILNVNIDGMTTALRFTTVGLRAMAGSPAIGNPASQLQKIQATNDTIKVTKVGYSIAKQFADVSTGTYDFKLGKTTSWNGDVNAFWGDKSTYPTDGQYIILNRTNGAFPDSMIYWSIQQNGTKVQLSKQRTVKIPNGGGRFYIWVAPKDSVDGGKNARFYDFVEVNWDGSTWNGNTTRVDGFRLPITYMVHRSTGNDTVMGDAYELFFQSRKSKFDEYVNEVPKEFIGLATQSSAHIWAPHMSPINYFNTGGPYVDYFKAYQDSVKAFNAATNPAPGATVSTWNIFACAGGGIGGSPDYSAAVNRHIGTRPPGANFVNWRTNDTAYYYKAAPCNYFSKWCHRRSINNFCYGFPYDDVGGHASFMNPPNVKWLAIAIGW